MTTSFFAGGSPDVLVGVVVDVETLWSSVVGKGHFWLRSEEDGSFSTLGVRVVEAGSREEGRCVGTGLDDEVEADGHGSTVGIVGCWERGGGDGETMGTVWVDASIRDAFADFCTRRRMIENQSLPQRIS